MKRTIALLLCVIMALGALSACGSVQELGTAAPEIVPSRGEKLENKDGEMSVEDLSSVCAFIDTLSDVTGAVGDYEIVYDPATKTAYATTKDANIALKVEDGEILFVSVNGSPETKALLNEGVAEVYLGTGLADDVDKLFDQIEQTRWVNQINSSVVSKAIAEFNLEPLDTTMMYAADPKAENIDSTLSMPVLTDSLEKAGVTDLTNYYEAPDLLKFWSEADTSGVESEINGIKTDSASLKAKYDSYKLTTPSLTPKMWSLDDYSLPSSFSDGKSANVGQNTASAYEQFSDELMNWRNTLTTQENDARQEAANGLS